MALIKCPECEKNVSSAAEKCPNCGYPIAGKQKTEAVAVKNKKEKKKGLLWKILAFIATCCIIGILFGEKEPSNHQEQKVVTDISHSSTAVSFEQTTEASTAESSEENIIDVDISDCHIKYLRHEIANNLAGEKCLIVYYEFTNNSKSNKAFDYIVSDKAFQDGIELQFSVFHVNDASKDSSAEIQPGKTITVASGFVLRNDSDVQLDVNTYISFTNKVKDSMVLVLQ